MIQLGLNRCEFSSFFFSLCYCEATRQVQIYFVCFFFGLISPTKSPYRHTSYCCILLNGASQILLFFRTLKFCASALMSFFQYYLLILCLGVPFGDSHSCHSFSLLYLLWGCVISDLCYYC